MHHTTGRPQGYLQCCPFRCRWLPAQHFMEKLLRLYLYERRPRCTTLKLLLVQVGGCRRVAFLRPGRSPAKCLCFNDASQLDANGFSALHHAMDCSSFSWHATVAAWELIPATPMDIIMHHTTGRPQGYNVVHFAAGGSQPSISWKNSCACIFTSAARGALR